MRTIAHISDLHFGTEDPQIADTLLADLRGAGGPATRPTVVAVSGDLTQRARESQFRAARAWLDRLGTPYVVVPGNHDRPLYDVVRRFLSPLERYRRIVTPDLAPAFVDEEIAVLGVDTTVSLTIKDGRISRAQTEAIAGRLAPVANRFKVLVAHHPFVLPPRAPERDRVDGAAEAVPRLEQAGIEVILTGHLHVAYLGDTAGFRSGDRAIVAVHAGTCMSTRRRGEPNGYNWITIDGDELHIVHRRWNGSRFVDAEAKIYRRESGHWRKLLDQAA